MAGRTRSSVRREPSIFNVQNFSLGNLFYLGSEGSPSPLDPPLTVYEANLHICPLECFCACVRRVDRCKMQNDSVRQCFSLTMQSRFSSRATPSPRFFSAELCAPSAPTEGALGGSEGSSRLACIHRPSFHEAGVRGWREMRASLTKLCTSAGRFLRKDICCQAG